MTAKAIVVFGQDGNPLAGATAIMNGFYTPLTNQDGYAIFGVGFAAGLTFIIIVANGYKNYIQPINLANLNQNIYIGGKSTNPNDINLPPLSFNKPSRESICNVKANFCNLFDADGIPIFDAFISSLIFNNQIIKSDDWFARLKAANTTHMNVALSIRYNENLGWAPTYPIDGIDLTKDLDVFSEILLAVQENGFIPIIKLAFDGQSYDSNGWTYGWQWGMDNIERIAKDLSPFIDTCLWSTGFDGCFPDWSRDQTIAMLQKMRAILGEQACIDTEFGNEYSHMGQGEADWADDKLGILDNFSIEVMQYPPDVNGLSQTAARLLGPAATNIIPEVPMPPPYYLRNTTKKVNICLYESIAYQITRKQATEQDAIRVANTCAFYGFKSFGNGQPNV